MLGNFFFAVIDYIFGFISFITGHVYSIFLNILQKFGIVTDNYLQIFTDFLSDSVFPGVKFARDVFIYSTGIDLGFYKFFIGLAFIGFNFYMFFLVFKFLLNVWGFVRIGTSTTSAISNYMDK